MCVIIVKPAGVQLPSDDILKAANIANPHGCGFATPTGLYKSLSFNKFMKRLRNVAIDEPCIIHFRLATHGSICTANCHPFNRGDVYFAHNGVLSIKPLGDLTDSETALQKYIYPSIVEFGLDSRRTKNIIEALIDGYSKFAIIKGDELRLYGDFIEWYDGCFYSNLRFCHMMRNTVRNGFLTAI